MFKKEYDAEVECLKGRSQYDAKGKKFTPQDIGNLCYTFIATSLSIDIVQTDFPFLVTFYTDIWKL